VIVWRTPRHVARWRRRPAIWSLLVLLVWATVMLADRDLVALEPTFAASPPVTATIEDTSRRWETVTVSYTDPATGRTVRDTIDVYDMDRFPPPDATTVTIELAPGSIREARVAGDVVAFTWNVELLALALLPLAWLVMRAWHVRATRRRIEVDGPAYRMLGRVQPGHTLRPPRLGLWPLDARPGDAPVCAIRLVRHQPHELVTTVAYDVKGTPRPFGAIIARDVLGNVLWPAGRALGWNRMRFHPPRAPAWPEPRTAHAVTTRVDE
jgi:hypothetical protein